MNAQLSASVAPAKLMSQDNLSLDKDDHGDKCISVAVNLLTGLCKLYCIDAVSVDNSIKSILSYICVFGKFDEIRSDPGVDYTSKLTLICVLKVM